MAALHFSAVIQILGANPYVLVTSDQAQMLRANWRKPMPVLVQVNSQPNIPWPINMMPVGNGNFYLYLHGDLRKASKTKVGDRVNVKVVFNEAYQNGPLSPLPDWLKNSLQQNSTIWKNWQALSPSRQKEIVRYFIQLKSPDARQRNIEKMRAVLAGETGRFMARDWEDGK